jgi:hypothetical protein
MNNLIKTLLLVVLFVFFGSANLYAQRYASRNGIVKLSYNAPHGKMETINRQVNAGLNVKTGEVFLRIVMLSFRFESAYNQEKFNEYFIANAHFANSSFQGVIENLDEIDFTRKGEYEARVRGKLTLRETTCEVATTGKFIVGDNSFHGKGVFLANLMDFNFKIPPSMEKYIEVSFEVKLQKL